MKRTLPKVTEVDPVLELKSVDTNQGWINKKNCIPQPLYSKNKEYWPGSPWEDQLVFEDVVKLAEPQLQR